MAKWEFLGEAERVLTAKGLKDELDAIGAALDGTELADTLVKREFAKRHWQTSERVWPDGNFSYDAFRDGVAVEAIGPKTSIERAIIYGLVKMELGRRRPARVDAGVLVVSTRTKRLDRPMRKPYFDRAVDFAHRLQDADILRTPIAFLGVDTQRARTR